MRAEFWNDAWSKGQIGFHQGAPNALLTKHADELRDRRRVLVPLCGKAVDLVYLRDLGLEVVGVEWVEEAVHAFFTEQEIAAVPVRIGALSGLTGGGITILAGDFFATEREALGGFDALYDRAALVALEPSTRARYVQHCRSLLEKDAKALVITFEYDQRAVSGPPFSVEEAAIEALFDGCDRKLLEIRDEPSGPRFAQAGITTLVERIHAIRIR